MCGSTLPLASTKTYGPISVDLREKRNFFYPFSLSLSSRSHSLVRSFFLPLLTFFFFYPFISFSFFKFGYMTHIASCVHLSFSSVSAPKQFILNELSSSHFPTSEIFVKILSLESLTTYHPKNRKNIPTISEFDETFLGHWI